MFPQPILHILFQWSASVVSRLSIESQDASSLHGLRAVAVLAAMCATSSEAEGIPVSVRAAWGVPGYFYNTVVCA